MQLAIATTSVTGSLERKLERIAEAGFTGFELHELDLLVYNDTPQRVGELAKDYGLVVDVYQGLQDFEGLRGSARERAFARLDYVLDTMDAVDARVLLVGTTRHPDTDGDKQGMADDFSALAERVAERNRRAALLALPWARHVQHETDALALVEAVDQPAFGLALNSFFSLADGSRPARLNLIPADRVFLVQLSDAPTMAHDIRHLKGHFGLLPGQGGLNLEGFVRVLARGGYLGPWSIAPIDDTAPDPGPRVAADGYRALVSLLDSVARTEPALRRAMPELPDRGYTTGFEFVEFAVCDDSQNRLEQVLESLSFRRERQHVSKQVQLWRQGAINIVVNAERVGFAADTYAKHGPSVCDMGLRVRDAETTVARAKALGAPAFTQAVAVGELDIPAITGVGGTAVHFIDEQSDLHRMWDIDFDALPELTATPPAGLRRIDHVAQTMRGQEMQSWLTYYTSTFEMRKRPLVDVNDPSGVVLSQAISSPEGEVRLILNGASERRTLAAAFLAEHLGGGVQHIALATDDIFETSARLDATGFQRLHIGENYYHHIQVAFDLEKDMIDALRTHHILYDREGDAEFLQIFSTPLFEGFFFEIVERRSGYDGYGERNAPIRLAAQKRQQGVV